MKRRDLIGLAACAAVGVAGTRLATSRPRAAARGRLRQSVDFSRFAPAAHWSLTDTVRAAAALGCTSIEEVPEREWNVLAGHGLTCAVVTAHSAFTGLSHPGFREANLQALRDQIDRCATQGFPQVLSFPGPDDATAQGGSVVSRAAGRDNCVAALREIAPYAERQGVTVLLEPFGSHQLSTRAAPPTKAGADLSDCAEIIRRVASPHVKLLFDAGHVQQTHGDLLRRLEDCRDILGHVRTAGNPGRGEIGPEQEINYAAIAHWLVDRGYQGYIGHAFSPVREPMAALREAVGICTVV